MLITYTLMLIEGILEDNRNRIQYLVSIQRSHNKGKKEDLVKLLLNFVKKCQEQDQRDLACRILAMLIEAHEYKNCDEDSKAFLIWLLN